MDLNDTATKIIDVAQELVQIRGYNAFSYRDLSERIGIKTSSIHYYFPNKEDLGAAMMQRYRERAASALARIDAEEPQATRRLARFSALFDEILANGERLCPWAMLATDYSTLPERVRAEVKAFYLLNESWLEKVLGAGREAGELAFPGSARAAAEALFAVLEGALVTARVFGDADRLTEVSRWMDVLLSARR